MLGVDGPITAAEGDAVVSGEVVVAAGKSYLYSASVSGNRCGRPDGESANV